MHIFKTKMNNVRLRFTTKTGTEGPKSHDPSKKYMKAGVMTLVAHGNSSKQMFEFL